MMGGEKYAEGKEQLMIEAYHTIYQTWWRHCYDILQKQPKSFSRKRDGIFFHGQISHLILMQWNIPFSS